MDLRIVSIGALSANPLWGERSPVRSGHSTTTLIRAGKKTILVDPGLPDQVIIPRLAERATAKPADITHIFLTSFNPELRRGILAFQHATWWIAGAERDSIGAALIARAHEAAAEEDEPLKATLQQEIAILHRCQPAPDHIADDRGERIDLFPLPGLTPGLTGLLIAGSRHTTLICGDAIPTVEHLEQGQVLQEAADVDKARESFSEAIEIADLLVLGRDNLAVNPTKRPF